MKNTHLLGTALLTLGLFVHSASAAVIYSEDFNSQTAGTGTAADPGTLPSGWVLGGTGTFFGHPLGGVQNAPITGNITNSFFLQSANAYFGATAAGAVSVATGIAYSSANTYTLSFDYIGKNNGNQFFRDASFVVELWEGSIGGAGTLLGTQTFGDTTLNSSTAVSVTSSTLSGGTGNLFINFATTIPAGSGNPDGFRQAMFDNVSLDAAPIPEPGAFAALAGAAALAFAARRRRRS